MNRFDSQTKEDRWTEKIAQSILIGSSSYNIQTGLTDSGRKRTFLVHFDFKKQI